ncbi:hypothetical protein V492_02879 [Pseudogymnoascus sp. VKM F-4246]|nr:hypothetical protein V492_02879 [Pseudogymnoascus sp. VKM F-4246]
MIWFRSIANSAAHAAWSDTQGPRDEWRYNTGSKYYNCPTEREEGCVAVNRLHSLPVTLGTSTANLPVPPQFDTEFVPLRIPYKMDEAHEYESRETRDKFRNTREAYEHIAGPNCSQLDGYNGHNISVEEMMDCSTVQCLYAKPDDWVSNEEDMYFETDSKYYLSGLSDHSSSGGWKQMYAPILHGRVQGSTDNDNNPWIDTEELQKESGVPFHPACFELFKIIGEATSGKVNIDGLAQLRNICCTSKTDFCDWGDDVRRCSEQCWLHLPDTEYLVANPIFIPGFRDICDNALRTDEDFDVQQTAFPKREGSRNQLVSGDPFLKLPSELVQNIVRHLESQEIAAMRLVSRAFEQLPISLWHRLLLDEFPCIYEAWRADVTPYKWASQDVNMLQSLRKEVEEWESQRQRKARDLDYDPELEAKFLNSEPKVPPWHTEHYLRELKEKSLTIKKRLEPIALPHEKTNWYQLYSEIVRHWEDLKGLQNRERICGAIGDICIAIEGIQGGHHKERDRNDGTDGS